MSGEFSGIREARARMEQKLRDSGKTPEQARKQADQIVRRADERIREGKQPKPTLRD